jgi:MoxR-like ATPase
VSVDGETRPLPNPFIVLATQNPIELEGTFALPEAQLDRFLLRIAMGYPSASSEHAIARRHQAEAEPLDRVPSVATAETVLALREAVRTVRVAGDVEAYLVSLVRATREHADVRLGASPRSSVALYRAAQAWAALDGRDYVLPDDTRDVAHAVLDHRILLDLDRELRGATPEGVVDAVLSEVPVPLAE